MSTVRFDDQPSGLVPQVVSDKISHVVSRTRMSRLLCGGVIALAVSLGVLLGAIGLDWVLTLFDPAIRRQITLVTLALMGGSTLVCLGLAAINRISRLDAAKTIDQQIPELMERWTSVSEFSSSNDPREIRGSEAFIQKVAEEAADLEKIVQPNEIRLGHQLTIATAGLLGVLGIWAVFTLADPGQIAILVRRFFSPRSEISLTQIHSESGDVVQPRGSSVKIEGVTTGRPRSHAELTIRKEGSPDEVVKLDPQKDDSNRFVMPIKNLNTPFDYRFRSGDGQSSWHQVRIAERPRLELINIRIIPPAYSKLPDFQQDGLPKSVKALQGSRLQLRFKPSIPLTSLVLQSESQGDHTLGLSNTDDYRWESDLNESIAFRPILTSTDGLLNAQPPRCEIIVFKDRAPSVEVANPTNDFAVRPDDSVMITFDAKDDFGIAKAELVVFDSSKPGEVELKTIPIELGEQEGAPSVRGQIELDLNSFNMKHGEQLSYAIRVYDTKDETATNQSGEQSSGDNTESLAKDDTDSRQSQGEPREDQATPDKPFAEKDWQDTASNDSSQNKSDPSDRNSDSKAANSKTANTNASDTKSAAAKAAETKSSDTKSADTKSAPSKDASSRSTDSKQDQKSDPKKGKDTDVAAKDSKPQEPKDQLQGGNTWTPKSDGKEEPQKEEGAGMSGKPRPEFQMAKRELDTPGQATSSSRRHIKIDEWAGSFASKNLEKLELQIDPVLAELKAVLVKARDTLQPISRQKKKAEQWKPNDSVGVRAGDELLDKALNHVNDLNAKSDGTPYAFIGLQLRDVSQLRISPAREHLHDVWVFDRPCPPDELSASVVHIERALELLEKLTRQYEAVKLNQKLADTMQQIKKMHQIFQEGTFALLKSQKPTLNPKDRAMMEFDLTEEYLEKLQALLQKKLEIQAELAKVLSQDPRLLQRFMARTRLEATTLRDQLTLVAERHKSLAEEVKAGLPEKEGEKLVLKNQQSKQAAAAAEILEETSKMFDKFVVWTPLDQDVDKGEFGRFKAKGVKLVDAATTLAREAADEKSTKALEASDALHEGLADWEKTLPELIGDDIDGKLQVHVANRLAEGQKLITDVSGWALKQQTLNSGDHHIAAEIEQHRITVDTMVLSRKLTSIRAQCQGMSVKLADLADDFLRTMENDLIPELEESQIQLDDNQLNQAVKHQVMAVEHFAKAEEQLDELMDGMIKHLDSIPFDEKPEFPDGVEPESLEALLAMLNDEARAAESLGIPIRPSNLIMEKDWSLPGAMPGAGGGGGRPFRAGAQMQQSKMASKKADRIRKELEDSLKKLSARGNATGNGPPEKAERRWNTLGSKLEDHLRQGRGNLPPEQYRKAIERYFESLAGKSDRGPKGD